MRRQATRRLHTEYKRGLIDGIAATFLALFSAGLFIFIGWTIGAGV